MLGLKACATTAWFSKFFFLMYLGVLRLYVSLYIMCVGVLRLYVSLCTVCMLGICEGQKVSDPMGLQWGGRGCCLFWFVCLFLETEFLCVALAFLELRDAPASGSLVLLTQLPCVCWE